MSEKFVRKLYTNDTRIELPYYNGQKLKRWYNDGKLVWADIPDYYVCFAPTSSPSYDSILEWTDKVYTQRGSSEDALSYRSQNAKGYMKIIKAYNKNNPYILNNNGRSRKQIKVSNQVDAVGSCNNGFIYTSNGAKDIYGITLDENDDVASETLLYQGDKILTFPNRTGGSYFVFWVDSTYVGSNVQTQYIVANESEATLHTAIFPKNVSFYTVNDMIYAYYSTYEWIGDNRVYHLHYLVSSDGSSWEDRLLGNFAVYSEPKVNFFYNTENSMYYAIVEWNEASIGLLISHKIYVSSDMVNWSDTGMPDTIDIPDIDGNNVITLKNTKGADWNIDNITINQDAFYKDGEKVMGGTPALTFRPSDSYYMRYHYFYMEDFSFSNTDSSYYVPNAFF